MINFVLGRFQFFHPGHIALLSEAFDALSDAPDDELIVCIGSAQIEKPFTAQERQLIIHSQMRIYKPFRARFVHLVDPPDLHDWVEYVLDACDLKNKHSTLYRGDKDRLTSFHERQLKQFGCVPHYVESQWFWMLMPDGTYRKCGSSTDVFQNLKDYKLNPRDLLLPRKG